MEILLETIARAIEGSGVAGGGGGGGLLLLSQALFELLGRLDQRLEHMARLIAGYQQRARGPLLAVRTGFGAFDAQNAVVETNRLEAVDQYPDIRDELVS